MGYIAIVAFILVVAWVFFLGMALIVTWRRVRRLEGTIAKWSERQSQGELLLHEFLSELEQAGESLLQQLDDRERALRSLVDQADQLSDANKMTYGSARQRTPTRSSIGAEQSLVEPISFAADRPRDGQVGERAPADNELTLHQVDTKNEEIKRLAEGGKTAEEIGRILHMGVGEVQLILDLIRLERHRPKTTEP